MPTGRSTRYLELQRFCKLLAAWSAYLSLSQNDGAAATKGQQNVNRTRPYSECNHVNATRGSGIPRWNNSRRFSHFDLHLAHPECVCMFSSSKELGPDAACNIFHSLTQTRVPNISGNIRLHSSLQLFIFRVCCIWSAILQLPSFTYPFLHSRCNTTRSTYIKSHLQTPFWSLCVVKSYAQGYGWMNGWGEVRHDPCHSHDRASEVQMDRQCHTRHINTQPRIDLKFLFSNKHGLLKILLQAQIFLSTAFLI